MLKRSYDDDLKDLLEDFHQKITDKKGLDLESLLAQSDEEKNICERCTILQADLDHYEMERAAEIETSYEKIRETQNNFFKVKAELDEQLKKIDLGSENLYKTYLLLIRTDLENLLGCDLPEVAVDTNNLPKL